MSADILQTINPYLREQAAEALRKRDVGKLLCSMPNTQCLDFVYEHSDELGDLFMLEACIVEAFTATRTNNRWEQDIIAELFGMVDRVTLREAGGALPEAPQPWRVFRGVAGEGDDRLERGYSWSLSQETAVWFARRGALMELPRPSVVSTLVTAEHVLFAHDGRQEMELVCELSDDHPIEVVDVAGGGS